MKKFPIGILLSFTWILFLLTNFNQKLTVVTFYAVILAFSCDFLVLSSNKKFYIIRNIFLLILTTLFSLIFFHIDVLFILICLLFIFSVIISSYFFNEFKEKK